MSDNREQRIRERAHSLWEADGKPDGREQDYWFRAEKLIDEERDPNAPGMTETPPL